MLRDAGTLDDRSIIRADVCIAGAGAAGITIADALRDSGLSVCLLESGGREVEAPTRSLSKGKMTGIDTWELHRMRSRQLGGTMGRWSGWCLPLEPEDFEARGWIPHSGWPFSYEALVPYYQRAQRRVDLGAFDYDAQGLADRTGRPLVETPRGRVASGFVQFSPPTRFGEKYHDTLEAASDVSTYLHANLTNIVLQAGHDRVDRFECKTLGGSRFTVEADRYVLALGGLENARVLLASDEQLEDGIGNGHGHLGRYFMEHPHYNGAAAWVVPGGTDLRFYLPQMAEFPAEGGSTEIPVVGYLALSPAVRAREGLPHMAVALTEASLADARTRALDPPVVQTLLRRREGEGRLMRMTVRAEQTPHPDSRITLTGKRDALGMRRLRLHWAIPDRDRAGVRRALEILGAELASANMGRLWTPTDGRRIDSRADAGGHHMGTTRMAGRAEDGVVDDNGRLFDVQNLYVAGSSVFPTAGAANPTLTIVALAERLADHLRGSS